MDIPTTKPYRATLFIDGNNFYYKLKDVVSAQQEAYRMIDLHYRNFAQALTKQNAPTDIRYYIGAVKRQSGTDREKAEKMYAGQQKLIARLRSHGAQVILGSLIQHPDRSFHEKGVDVRLAVEMIRLAREDQYDVAYLLSSDTDLVPAVEEVHSFNKKVVYVGMPKGQSFGLTKAADYTILLREEDIIPYIPLMTDAK